MAVDTAKILQERRDIDFSSRIAELEPDAGPLTVLLKKLDKTTVDTAEFRWFESERNPRWGEYAGSDESGTHSTTLQVDDASIFRKNEVLIVPRTGEVMLITADPNKTNNTIQVVRGYSGTTAADLQTGDAILILNNAHEENAKAGPMKVVQPYRVRNYTQIIRNPVMISGTLDAEKQRANPRERLRLQRKAGVEHLIDIEYALWFGKPYEDLSGPHPRRTTGGVLHFVTENILDVRSEAGGKLSFGLLEEWLEDAFRYGSSEKWLFAAPRVISVLDILAENKLRVQPREKTYGVQIQQWVSAHGTINIVKHNLFEGDEYGHMAVLLDLDVDELAYVHLEGRDTKLRLNIGDPDRDGYMDEYLTECGLRLPLAKRHAAIFGVEEAASS